MKTGVVIVKKTSLEREKEYRESVEEIKEKYGEGCEDFELHIKNLRKNYPDLFGIADLIEEENGDLASEFWLANGYGEWNPSLLKELCKRAGLLAEWKAADSEGFENVVFHAANILEIDISKTMDFQKLYDESEAVHNFVEMEARYSVNNWGDPCSLCAIVDPETGKRVFGAMYGDDECIDLYGFYQFLVTDEGQIFQCRFPLWDMEDGTEVDYADIDYERPYEIEDITKEYQ